MIDRRTILKTAAAGVTRALGAADPPSLHLGCQTNAWPIVARDFGSVLAVLRKIQDYGYEGFETGFANVERQFGGAAAARRQLEAIGPRFFGIHIFLQQYDPATSIAPAELYEGVARGGAALGAERLILSGAAASGEARKRKAEALNRAGDFAGKAGLSLAYHSHGPEAEHGGEEIEFLLRETEPGKVWLLLDAGHAFEAGADVPALIRRFHTRMAGMHLRDFRNGEQVPLGGGDFPLRAVVDTVRRTGWSGWVLNEEERVTSKPGDAAVKPARDALFRAFQGMDSR
jgi:sugar phosphate isomerase/epimerase